MRSACFLRSDFVLFCFVLLVDAVDGLICSQLLRDHVVNAGDV